MNGKRVRSQWLTVRLSNERVRASSHGPNLGLNLISSTHHNECHRTIISFSTKVELALTCNEMKVLLVDRDWLVKTGATRPSTAASTRTEYDASPTMHHWYHLRQHLSYAHNLKLTLHVHFNVNHISNL